MKIALIQNNQRKRKDINYETTDFYHYRCYDDRIDSHNICFRRECSR